MTTPTPFRFDNRSFDTPPDKWQAGDPWDKRYTDPVNEDRDRSIEDYVTSRVTETLNTLASGIVFAKSVVNGNPAVYDAFQAGTATDTWTGSDGTSGTGYPRINATIRSSGTAIVIVSGSPFNIANAAAYKCFSGFYGFGVDGAIPVGNQLREFRNSNANVFVGPSTFTEAFTTTAGVHEFKLWVYFANAGGAVFFPEFDSSSVTVFPI